MSLFDIIGEDIECMILDMAFEMEQWDNVKNDIEYIKEQIADTNNPKIKEAIIALDVVEDTFICIDYCYIRTEKNIIYLEITYYDDTEVTFIIWRKSNDIVFTFPQGFYIVPATINFHVNGLEDFDPSDINLPDSIMSIIYD